jgi:hypothetical protein
MTLTTTAATEHKKQTTDKNTNTKLDGAKRMISNNELNFRFQRQQQQTTHSKRSLTPPQC